jgi:TIR domain/N-6 DNA Methylase
VPVPHTAAVSLPVRVFISYAHGNPEHEDHVRRLWRFLCEQGIDARLDRPAAEQRQDWSVWMLQQIRAARFVLMIASPEYRRRAEGEALASEGRGVQWEAGLIREEVYADQKVALNRFLPVVLPGVSAADIPQWMGPTTTTHYTVSDYTVRGADKLLRLLTDQPYETQPPLGSVPVLLPRRAERSSAAALEDVRDILLRRLVDRTPGRNEAMVQADVRQFLAAGDLGLEEHDLGAEPDAQTENRRRIDIAGSRAVIEVRKDLRAVGVLKTAGQQLASYVAARSELTGQRYVAVLTDGAEWRLYHRLDEGLQQVKSLIFDPSAPDVEELLIWLESVLASGRQIEPTPREIIRKLGADSPEYALDSAELRAIYAKCRELSAVKVKRAMWAKLLTTASGTNFTDDDSLFVDHTLLVAMAEVIGHAVVGFRPEDPTINAATIMSGALFSQAQIGGVIEADFFDWVVHVPDGERFIKDLSRRLTRFAWGKVQHDVMKVLYESIIPQTIRHRLGEYYTPDWLAEEIVAECVNDPLSERVLDASCGSGTFLFHAVRNYVSAAESAGRHGPDIVREVGEHVIGFDVHPVAVTLARVTYLLAIGMHRLQADDRPAFAVPVYLGDSLRWGQESTLWSYGGLSVPTVLDHDTFVSDPEFTVHAKATDQLKFPDSVVANAGLFDQLVTELAEKATNRQRGTAVPSLAATFRRFEIKDEDRAVLEPTFEIMCELHDQDRDHIWGYYVRNLARPVWLARPDNRIDVLVGNPPWLAYRYMTHLQQASFRTMSTERRLWAGAAVATNQDLSALFVARCIELYLRPGGRFGYVMPWAVLSRRQYAGFRTGYYPVQAQPVKVSFDRPWDLHLIKPTFFQVPASVILGRRVNNDVGGAALSQTPEVWSGRFATATASRAQAAASIARTPGEPALALAQRRSPYAHRFVQGATVVPRFLFLVESDNTNPLGAGAGRRAVRSRRNVNEKKPWKDLAGLRGTVERRFIRPLYLGDSILPFRTLPAREAIVPWDAQRLLHGKVEHLDLYPGLANWWRRAEDLWTRNRSSERLDLIEQLDYRKKLSQQFPAADHRVIYTKSGMYLAAAIVSDPPPLSTTHFTGDQQPASTRRASSPRF